MRKAATKSLYLFLCSILGMILFTMLHRSIFVLYGLLLDIDFQTYSLGMSEGGIMILDFFSMLAALFIGGWYGILLGIDWYAIVYGPNAEYPARLFHGFVPHHWRGAKKKTVKTENKPEVATVTVKTPVVEKMSTILNTPIMDTPPVVQKVREWTFDDLLAKPEPAKKPSVRKVAAKKTTARKSVTKRTPKVIS